ncbi:cyclic nucleotide-gated cation channel beta-1-like [Helianthus annuus]|uniref:cyclic nucleotide-gated cation channel beta-1-like n=1 Tax=Helianthus annuus TaxID=4232 RepID=UPI001652D5E4|nr:cyclic nucleotide-gated cation channel beta-1-like [Helianthus annuus]
MPKIVLKKKTTKETRKPPTPPHESTPPQSPIQSPPRQPTPPQQSSPPKQPTPPRQPSPLHHSPPPQQTLFTSQELFQTPPLTQMQPGLSSKGLYTPHDNLEDIGDFGFANNEQVLKLEKRMDEVLVENKKLVAENKKVSDREKILEMRVKKLEIDNKELVKKIESDQSEIDILKVKIAELEEEKARPDEQNEYFKLKNKEFEAAKALRDHEFYMLNKVVESMLGTSVEQKFEELQVEELRAERQAKIAEQMKDKGKGVEGSSAVTERSIVPSMVVDNPEPISAVSGLFEDYTPLEELMGDSDEDDEEEEDEEEDKKDEKVYSVSSHGSDDDDDDAQGGTALKVTEDSAEQNVDNLMNDSVNEESGGADRQGKSGDAEDVLLAHKLILRLDTYCEEGEHFHTYTLEAINAEFEEELNAFDINQQRDYEYKYVEDADMYDRVEVEDWTDDENINEDTSQLPTLMEFFTEENRDELRRKVAEILKDKNFDGTQKDMAKEERKKWFKESHERKFKRPLKYYQRDRSVSLGDIISWVFLPQINAYAIRRECGVQYFEKLHDIMSLPWWDVDELSKVRTLGYNVRKNDIAMWGLIKFEALRDFKHWKPHHPKRVTRRDQVTGVE